MRKKVFLITIALAFFLRFWQLGRIPPSLDWDEVAIGYNAWSLLRTGKDEYGQSWPLVFRSFDDYKPPLYFYLSLPAVRLLGLTEFAVRFPSAFFGSLAVVATYFLVKELFSRAGDTWLPEMAALLLAISPWHLYFCRIGFEANVGAALNIFAAWAFLRSLRQSWFLPLSAFLFGLGLWVYHSERIFVPLLVLGWLIIWRKKLFRALKPLIIAGLVGLLFFLPLMRILLDPENMMRMKGVSSFADPTVLFERSAKKLLRDQKKNNLLGFVLDNRRLVLLKKLIEGYLSPFNLGWLFLSGDNPRHKAPDMGLLYLWELPFLLLGLYTLAKTEAKSKATLFWWFLVAPVAASPTTELPHAVRTIVFLPTFQIFTALGLTTGLNWLKNKKSIINQLLAISYSLFVILNLSYFFSQYFIHLPLEFSESWQYGRKQAVALTGSVKNKYQKIIVSTELEQPHMFWLFYSQYPPEKYLSEGGTKSGGFEEYENKFGIYEFRPIDWQKDQALNKVLLVGLAEEFPAGIGTLKTINYLDGSEAIKIIERP